MKVTICDYHFEGDSVLRLRNLRMQEDHIIEEKPSSAGEIATIYKAVLDDVTSVQEARKVDFAWTVYKPFPLFRLYNRATKERGLKEFSKDLLQDLDALIAKMTEDKT